MLIVVAGTGTEVGKTWCTAAGLRVLRAQGVPVAARKPAQSFADGGPEPTDAAVLASETGEEIERVCPRHRWYPIAMAPPMAAAALGRPGFTIADLVRETRVEPGVITFVETAGGVRSPLADDGDNADFCRALGPDLVVLVADAGLGTINAVRMSADALQPHRIVVLLNRYDAANPLHVANRAWLVERDALDVVASPEELAARLSR